MSETATEEQVAEDIPQGTDPAPAAEVDAVDAFLAEFEEQEPEPQAEPEPPTDLAEIVKRQGEELAKLRDSQSAEAINAHVGKLKDSLRSSDEAFANLPDDLISDFLDGAARRMPGVNAAFEKSISDTKTFEGLVGALKARLSEQVNAVATRNIAEDIKAATSSARGVSTSQPAPEPVNTTKMSQAEFEAYVKTLPRS